MTAAEPAADSWDRTPPHDIGAEQCVLGAMMLTPTATADVTGQLATRDFYRPAHQTIYDTIVRLYTAGQPTDPHAVARALTDNGQYMRVGAAPYPHTLLAAVPTAANAGWHAATVADRATLRRLVEAGTRIVQLGYQPTDDTPAVVDAAQAEIYDVAARRGGDDPVAISTLMQPTLDELEAIAAHGGQGDDRRPGRAAVSIQAALHAEAEKVACPACGASVDQRCTTRAGRPARYPHLPRVDLARARASAAEASRVQEGRL